jgi:hypothetical protein
LQHFPESVDADFHPEMRETKKTWSGLDFGESEIALEHFPEKWTAVFRRKCDHL